MPTTLRIKGLECEKTTIEATDEIRLRVEMDGDYDNRIFAGDMKKGSARNIEWSRDFDTFATITMTEYDRIGRDETIDVLTIRSGDPLYDYPYRRNPYNFTGHGAHYLLYYDLIDPLNPPEIYTLELIRLTCNDAQERRDHPYIAIDGDVVWGPVEMRTGQTLSLGAPHGPRRPFIRGAHITLWDHDPSVNDLFGRRSVDTTEVSDHPMEFRADSGIVGDARYTLTYTVRRGWP
jgi:hypothetical protein